VVAAKTTEDRVEAGEVFPREIICGEISEATAEGLDLTLQPAVTSKDKAGEEPEAATTTKTDRDIIIRWEAEMKAQEKRVRTIRHNCASISKRTEVVSTMKNVAMRTETTS